MYRNFRYYHNIVMYCLFFNIENKKKKYFIKFVLEKFKITNL